MYMKCDMYPVSCIKILARDKLDSVYAPAKFFCSLVL